MKTLKILFLMSCLYACGENKEEDKDNSILNEQVDPVSKEEAKASIRGFVANAFEVTVDGEAYPDLEAFYTAEIQKLPEKVKVAGYADVKSVRFEAQIGFQDLFQGMEVYSLATGKTGYQGNSRVGSDGSFAMTFPVHSATYRIRANKRIRVILQRTATTMNICYNFSAIEKSAPLDGEPLILSDFSSSLTAYDCPASSTSTELEIPENTEVAKAKILPGLTKAEVLTALGSDGLFIETARWCWRTPILDKKHANCERANGLVCQCHVTFDANGKLESQYNIATDRMDILSW